MPAVHAKTLMRDREIYNRQLTRKEFLQFVAGSLGGVALLPTFPSRLTWGADTLAPLNRFPRMMQDYFGERIAAASEKSKQRIGSIKSKDEALAFVQEVRRLIRDCFGPFPERTPLKPKITGIIDREKYRIEKVLFESRPDFLVSANLYVPKGLKSPRPGIIATCGHSANGKAAEAYQSFAQASARLGNVVLIFDPIGQGERLQVVNEELKSRIGVGVPEHLSIGNRQFLIGEFLGNWMAWDGIRALDYLLTRDEVDPTHIGVTGNSGGGTATMWLCGLEQRFTMAAPSCAVTTFRRNFENELPTDTEQCPPRALLHGIDHADFLAAMAPKPVIVIAAERDYFDVRGSIETYERLKPLYRWLGAESNLQLFIGPNEHGYTQPNREAMYSFFAAHSGIEWPGREPELTIESGQELTCTTTGQVVSSGSRSVNEFTAISSQLLAKKRGPAAAKDLERKIADLIPARGEAIPDFEILRPVRNRKYPKPHATTYAVETEPHVRSIVTRLDDRPHLSRPPQSSRQTLLYVSHQSSDAELRGERFLRDQIEAAAGSDIYCVDLRGIGDTQPQTCGENQYLEPYGSDYFYAAHAIMFGQSYPALRAFDLLQVIRWIQSIGPTTIHLVACGWGTIPATLAAVVSPEVAKVTLFDSLDSFSSIAETDRDEWPLSSYIPGILNEFDLPDCYRALATKDLTRSRRNPV